MSLKIIGVGFGRTGTLSTYTALNQLGYPCYHMMEVANNSKNKGHLDFWLEVAESPAGAQADWNRVFENYTATVDNPACCVWRELVEYYPEAKVILSLHPKGAEAWYESTMETIYLPVSRWEFKFLSKLIPFARKMLRMSSKLIWQRSHKGTMLDKEAAIARYHEHIEEVKSSIPPEKLLIFKVNQGWEPLCEFLGEAVPENDFPRVNDRQNAKRMMRNFSIGAYAVLSLVGLLLLGLVLGLIYFLGS